MQISRINKEMMEILQRYFEGRDDIVFAFLFGSGVKSKVRKEGDIDIAVYFRPEKDLEWEVLNKRYKGESRVALDLERLLKKEVDLIVLNRARAVLADEIIRRGKPIVIKDKSIFMDFLCIISDEAEYVRDWFVAAYRERRFESNR